MTAHDGTGVASTGLKALLGTLEDLLGIDAVDLPMALTQASQRIAEALRVDKVDAFLHEPATDTLVAVGTSPTPMGRKQKALGLDRLPLANGGRAVQVYRTGEPFLTGRSDLDAEELRGIKDALGIRSTIAVRFNVEAARRGVLLLSSAQPDRFSEDDLSFTVAVSRWVGMIAHRAQLVEQIARNAADQGRRTAADELVTVLAHDVRNHLDPLAGRLALIHRRAIRDARDADVRDAERAQTSIRRLARLVDDLLDVARLDQGVFKIDAQPVDLVALVHEVTQGFTTATSSFQVAAPPDLVVSADPNRVRQVLENLVANAVRYSPTGLAVVVQVSTQARQDGPWAIVTVSDQGPGIAPDMLPHVFDRFRKSPGSTGLGLGLHLASRIATAHGGTLKVESEPGKGARFELALPQGDR